MASMKDGSSSNAVKLAHADAAEAYSRCGNGED